MNKSIIGIIAALVWSAGSLFAATWTGTTSGNWQNSGNWTGPANVPNILGETAVFAGARQGGVSIGVTNIIGAGSQSLDVNAGTYTFVGATGSRLIVDANTNAANNTFSVRGTGQLTVDTNSNFTFRNSATLTHGFAHFRMYTFSSTNPAGGKLYFNGKIEAETSVDIRASGTNDVLAMNGDIALTADRGLWFSSVTNGASLSLNGQVTGSGTSFVELGATMQLGNTNGAAMASSVSRVGITQSAYITLDANDQIAANIDTIDTAAGGVNGNRTLDLNGYSNTGAGTLNLGDAFTLNLNFSNAVSEAVAFLDSSAITWTNAAVLNLIGFGTNDTLRFGTNANGLTAQQLSQITVDGAPGVYALDSNGYFGGTPSSVSTWVGTTANWNTGSNWSPLGVPNVLGDTVIFKNNGAHASVYLGATTNTIGGGEPALVIQSDIFTFTGSATGLLVIDAGLDTVNDTFAVKGALTVDADVNMAFKNSGTSDHGFAKTRIYTEGFSPSTGKLTFNGNITAETSIDIRANRTNDVLAMNGNIALSANRGLWFSFATNGASLSLNGQVTGSGTSFVELGATMRLGNTNGAAIASSVSRVGVTQSAYITLDANDQIATSIGTIDTATGGADGNRTLDLNGYSNTNAGTLILGDAFTLNLNFSNAASEAVAFLDSSAISWNGTAVLNLIGFTTNDTLRFGTTANGLSAQQLSQITVDGAAGSYALDGNGFFSVAQYTTNGTPYSWLTGYGFANPEADDLLDQDADGLKTWQEYIAGTVPTNKASCLRAAQTTRNTVTWTAQSNRIYSVYWSTNLVKGFTNLNDNIAYPQSSYTNTSPDSRVNHYQVRVRME